MNRAINTLGGILVALVLASTLQAGVITAPTDPIYAVNVLAAGDDISYLPVTAANNHPVNEAPAKAIDGIVLPFSPTPNSNKYLNFGKVNVGFIVVPSMGPSMLTSVQMATANDDPRRDPMTITIEGTNEPFNDSYLGVFNANWTLVYSGSSGLEGLSTNDAAGRNAWGIEKPIAGAGIYSYYRVLITSIRDVAGANSLQFSEIALNGVPEPVSLALLGLAFPVLWTRRRRA